MQNARQTLWHESRDITRVSLGFSIGITIATCVAWFGGTVYREGTVFAPFLTLLLVTAVPILLCPGLTQRLSYSLLTAVLFSGFCLLLLKLGGRTTPAATFALGIAALAVPFGIDLALKDSEDQLTVFSTLSKSAAGAFLATILPLSIWMLAHETCLCRGRRQRSDTNGCPQYDPRTAIRSSSTRSIRTSKPS